MDTSFISFFFILRDFLVFSKRKKEIKAVNILIIFNSLKLKIISLVYMSNKSVRYKREDNNIRSFGNQ
jgi:hypothetical protein